MKLSTCRHCGASVVQGALGCLGCGRLVDEHDTAEPTGSLQTQLGTRAKDALLDARWRLIQPVGRGKHATAWLAHDVPFDRRVVVKLLDEAAAREPVEVERFEQNARVLARVEHKNVVAVLALGRHGGVPFVAMRHVEGRSLAEHLHARGGRLPPGEAAQLVAQLAEAFEAVHAAGGPQGTLRPRAIFVSETDGAVTLLDVRGAATAAEGSDATTQHTERLQWLAPEVLAGQSPTVRSDVFTLGCVLWELLSGAPPPSGEPVPPLPEAGALGEVIARATKVDPAERCASAQELFEALQSAPPSPLVGERAGVRGPSSDAPLQQPLTPPLTVKRPALPREAATVRNPAQPGPRSLRGRDAAIVVALALPAFALYAFFAWERPPPPPPPIALLPSAPPAPPESEEAKRAEAILDAHVTPESVLERKQVFERLYTDERGKGRGRLKAMARSRPQVAEYFGKPRFGELQVIVLYGGQEVSIDVSIDGALVGPSPIFRPLKPGPHVITIERSPLEPVKVPVVVTEHKSLRMEIELVPLE